jgi:hypothetical protein
LSPKTIRQNYKQKPWITTEIKVSCKNKRVLYDEVKKSNSPILNTYYKNYCKILTRVINKAKKMAYDKQIKYSKNKVRTTWRIINNELVKKTNREKIHSLSMEGNKISNLNNIANSFNKYFTEVADNIQKHIKENGPNDKSEPMGYMTYLTNAFESPFQIIKVTKTKSKEIESIILSLKASQSHGYDEISNNILKECKIFISEPITFYVIRFCLRVFSRAD